MTSQAATRGDGLLEMYLAKKRAAIANSLIPDNLRKGSILDIGCGSYPHFLVNTPFSGKFAMDRIDVSVWHEIQQDEIVILNQDVESNYSLPFDDNAFTVVTMLAVIEHLNPDIVLPVMTEIQRVLKKGGIFVMTTPMPWTDKLLKLLAKFNIVSSEEIDEHKATYNTARLSSLFRQASFSDDKIRAGYFELYMNLWAMAEK